MDVCLDVSRKNERISVSIVSILVLMDVCLDACSGPRATSTPSSFNPCFDGCMSGCNPASPIMLFVPLFQSLF